jgi:metal-sulfur cluster biosynthetic enzyme
MNPILQSDVAVREATVRQALESVVDPCSIATGVPISLADMGLIKDLRWLSGEVEVVLQLTSPICWQAANIIDAVERAVMTVPGARSVKCTLDPGYEWTPKMMSAEARERLRRIRPLPKVAT